MHSKCDHTTAETEHHDHEQELKMKIQDSIEKKMMRAKMFSEWKKSGMLEHRESQDQSMQSLDSIRNSPMIDIEQEEPKKKDNKAKEEKKARALLIEQQEVYVQKMQQREAL